MAKVQKYDASSIAVLEDVEAVRHIASQYIGSTDSQGMAHLPVELFDNGCDEYGAGNRYVGVAFVDDAVWIVDHGRGIPVGKHAKTGISTLTTIFTSLHAGGKFGSTKANSAYGATGGVHGMGSTVANALCSSLEVWTLTAGKWAYQSFAKGVPTSKVISAKPKPATFPKGLVLPKRGGTVIRMVADKTIFDKGATIEVPYIRNRVMLQSFLKPGLQTNIVVRGKHETWHSKSGLIDLLKLRMTEGKQKGVAEVGLATKSWKLALAVAGRGHGEWFTNGITNPQGGTHAGAFEAALIGSLKRYTVKGDVFEAADVMDLMYVVGNISVEQPRFANQTKGKLSDNRAKDTIPELEAALAKHWRSHVAVASELSKAAAENYRARVGGKNNRKLAAALSKLSKNGTLLPGKLASCPRAKPSERELFFVEGDSAAGPAKMARNHAYQEVMTLGGKPLNAAKAPLNKTLATQAIVEILGALGYQSGAKDPLAKLRVTNKMVILADADPDGDHIALLVATALAKVLSGMFGAGMVYNVVSPEFWTEVGGKRYYGSKAEIAAQLPPTAKPNLRHIKGWGELSPAQLREVAFDPATRKLEQLTVDDSSDVKWLLELMGNDGIGIRRGLIGLDVLA